MARTLLGVLVGVLAFSLPMTVEAASKKRTKRAKQYYASQDYDRSATARQRANSRAYERGEYYEQMSDAHVFGSRSWWLLKEREMSGSSRN